MRGYTAAAKSPENQNRVHLDNAVLLSPELIEEYLESLQKSGCASETIATYRLKLNRLYQHLPEDKRIRAGTLEAWRRSLLESGYANSTINGCTAAANGLMNFCGHRELQIEKPLKYDYGIQPELTRNEYLRLLSAARTLGKDREYFLIKVFASTGLILHDLPYVTAEAVREGKIKLQSSVLHIPGCLQEELLGYIRREGIAAGPLFVTKTGTPIARNSITKMIQGVCRAACVDEKKATPRCLKKLYQTTRAGIQANLSLLAEQAYDRFLETEQLSIGWERESEGL